MKFLVDAQLPRQLVTLLTSAGHDAVHTSSFPLGNRTPDSVIATRADREDRVVITKDRDFWVSHVIKKCPKSLLLVATGNTTNKALLEIFAAHVDDVIELLESCTVVEMGRDRLIGHASQDPESGETP
ncbi:DUF5615 family PIN-like protein [Nocardia sp. NPDC050793]|uniref:DUF5615 family PIN-like protein n=1 Tax=Nocardia sp. NPDC050793 TaxID=3155159 RepID=UPI0033E03696